MLMVRMRLKSSRFGRRALALGALIVLIPSLLLATGIIGKPSPGIVLEFKLYDLRNGKLELWKGLSSKDVHVGIFIQAVAPPSFGSDLVPIYIGRYKGEPIFIPASGKLGKIAKMWIEDLRSKGNRVEGFETSLIVFIEAINISALKTGITDEVVLFSYADSISYRPIDIVSGKTLKYVVTIGLRGHSGFTVRIEKSTVSVAINVPGITSVYAQSDDLPGNPEEGVWRKCYDEGWGILCDTWERALFIAPENMTSILPSSYFNYDCGPKPCLKTPVLIVYNDCSYSGTVSSSISIEFDGPKISISASLAIGKIIDKIRNGIGEGLPDIKFTGPTWGGEYYDFYEAVSVPPCSWRWIWIWARPVYGIYKHYVDYYIYNYGRTRKYVNDYALAAITYVYVENTYIQGGVEYTKPHDSLLNYLFEGTNETMWGSLDPGKGVRFKRIFQTYDTCGADLEIPIAVGAAIAAVAKYALGITNPSLLAFLASFTVDLKAEGASVYIEGGIANNGDTPENPNDYNAVEYIFLRIAKFRYRYETPWSVCYYKVPVGIFVRSW